MLQDYWVGERRSLGVSKRAKDGSKQTVKETKGEESITTRIVGVMFFCTTILCGMCMSSSDSSK